MSSKSSITQDSLPPSRITSTTSTTLPISTLGNVEFDLGDLDQLGPLIRTLVRAGREETYLEQLSSYVQSQESEIERLCNFHYQEFIQSVDQLLKVRAETMALKSDIADIFLC
ncbi:hypothetical protein HMI55_001364 [Coelomomyces lativittatus]|nr:hypothetical protein HMI55_001364 [Coelomomyces lativittatus]